jgi:large subunit ribosomal protein L35
MPKMKSHSGAKKRFRATKTGKIKAKHTMRSHLLAHKPAKRTRRLARPIYLAKADAKRVRRLVPNLK